jgi:hypothetical protein
MLGGLIDKGDEIVLVPEISSTAGYVLVLHLGPSCRAEANTYGVNLGIDALNMA